MRRSLLLAMAVVMASPIPAAMASSLTVAAAAHPSSGANKGPAVGRTLVMQGFAVTPRWVARAHEAGLADYVAARGNVFLFVDIQVRRQGAHESYDVDPLDFHIVTSRGDVIDSEQFGLKHELKARHIYRNPVEGVVGFEVPANDRHLVLLWQPILNSNPDAQAEWSVPAAGSVVGYYS